MTLVPTIAATGADSASASLAQRRLDAARRAEKHAHQVFVCAVRTVTTSAALLAQLRGAYREAVARTNEATRAYDAAYCAYDAAWHVWSSNANANKLPF